MAISLAGRREYRNKEKHAFAGNGNQKLTTEQKNIRTWRCT